MYGLDITQQAQAMTEVGWWYTGLFFIIVAVFYVIGFWAGKNWERITWEDKTKPKVKKITGRTIRPKYQRLTNSPRCLILVVQKDRIERTLR